MRHAVKSISVATAKPKRDLSPAAPGPSVSPLPPPLPPPLPRDRTWLVAASVLLLAVGTSQMLRSVSHSQRGNIASTQPRVSEYDATTPPGATEYEGDCAPAGACSVPEPLSDAEIHGAWNLTWQVFDRATKHPNATVVSWASPRAVLIRDFLAPDEVEHLIQAAEGSFSKSFVGRHDDPVYDWIRTSEGAWLADAKRDAKVREIEARIHDVAGIPHPFGEHLHILRYKNGAKYEMHPDYCHADSADGEHYCREFVGRAGGPRCGPGGGGITCGDRLATVILYLRSPKKGGATVFPHATNYRVLGRPNEGAPLDAEAEAEAEMASAVDVPDYCQEDAPTLQLTPPPGSAVLFWCDTEVCAAEN